MAHFRNLFLFPCMLQSIRVVLFPILVRTTPIGTLASHGSIDELGAIVELVSFFPSRFYQQWWFHRFQWDYLALCVVQFWWCYQDLWLTLIIWFYCVWWFARFHRYYSFSWLTQSKWCFIRVWLGEIRRRQGACRRSALARHESRKPSDFLHHFEHTVRAPVDHWCTNTCPVRKSQR